MKYRNICYGSKGIPDLRIEKKGGLTVSTWTQFPEIHNESIEQESEELQGLDTDTHLCPIHLLWFLEYFRQSSSVTHLLLADLGGWVIDDESTKSDFCLKLVVSEFVTKNTYLIKKLKVSTFSKALSQITFTWNRCQILLNFMMLLMPSLINLSTKIN